MNLAKALTHLLDAMKHARYASRRTREMLYAAIDRWCSLLSQQTGAA